MIIIGAAGVGWPQIGDIDITMGNLNLLLSVSSSWKRRAAALGKAAARGKMLSDGGMEMVSDRFGRGGKSLPRPCDPGDGSWWPLLVSTGTRSWG